MSDGWQYLEDCYWESNSVAMRVEVYQRDNFLWRVLAYFGVHRGYE